MPSASVTPVLDVSVRRLCVRPYRGHPRGCPNFNKKPCCPPQARLFENVFDLDRPVIAVWNVFDLAAHVDRMRAKHPGWSWAQLVCCLYWQAGARKKLRIGISKALLPGMRAEACPEAMGVDVTATMASIGVTIEWPPVTTTIQVALLAYPREAA